MLSLLEVARRSQSGPRMEEDEWNMSLFRRMLALSKKYDIKYPGDSRCVNLDDSLADRVFLAALEFLSTDGVYNVSTGRAMQFSEAEIRQAVQEIPAQIIVGEDRDQRLISRKVVEGKEPLNQCPGHHAPFSEELAPLVVKNFAQIPTGDYLEGINFAVVDGIEIFGMPLEAYAARRELAWLREGVRKAGRPGMAIAYYPINTRAAVLLAPMDPDYGLRRTDGILLSTLPDVKVEHDLLTAAIVYQDYGCFKVNGGGSGLIGGFCGGVEGAMIESVAKSITGWLVYRDTICNTGVGSTIITTSSQIRSIDPGILWGTSAVLQALNRNSNTICFSGGALASGPGTRSNLIELAARAIVDAVNGANLYIPRQSRARMNASQVPLMAEWMAEAAEATIRAGITREKSEDLLRNVYGLVKDKPVERGVEDVRECYDLVNHLPSAEYQKVYEEVKEVMAGFGLAFQ